MKLLKKRTQYVLADKETGDQAMWCHQDDMENPIVAPTIEQLISAASEWADFGECIFLEEMRPGGSLEKYVIAKEVLVQSCLSAEEADELKRIIAEINGE